MEEAKKRIIATCPDCGCKFVLKPNTNPAAHSASIYKVSCPKCHITHFYSVKKEPKRHLGAQPDGTFVLPCGNPDCHTLLRVRPTANASGNKAVKCPICKTTTHFKI